jgi:hypothetical protein
MAMALKATSDDRRTGPRSTDVDQALALLRQAVSECGYTFDALQAATGKDKAYLHRVLNGEDRCTLDFITALPDDIEARFENLRATQFGLIVVEPVDLETARRHLVSGLVGVLAPRLPLKADRMAHAGLPSEKASAVR